MSHAIGKIVFQSYKSATIMLLVIQGAKEASR